MFTAAGIVYICELFCHKSKFPECILYSSSVRMQRKKEKRKIIIKEIYFNMQEYVDLSREQASPFRSSMI